MKKTVRELAARLRRTLDATDEYATAECLKFIEAEARRVLRKSPKLDEFVMAMGSAFFTLKDGELPDARDRNPSVSKVPAAKDLDEFIDAFDDALYLTGQPMRFTAGGPVVREW